MKNRAEKLEKIVLILAALGYIAWGVLVIYRSSFVAVDGRRYFCLFDDAMISMRYAWNFSHHLGLVWNAGEAVQGYSNFLMTILMTLPTLLLDKSLAALSVQIFGIITMLAIATVSMNIADHLLEKASAQMRAFIRVLAFITVLCYYPLSYWSLMGMETGLLSLLEVLGVLFALKFDVYRKPIHLFLASLSMALAYLTRSDSLIYSLLIWVFVIWGMANKKEKITPASVWAFIGAFGVFCLAIAGLHLFQYLYYGEILPNTYTLKLTGMPLMARLRNGIAFVMPFLKESGFILVVVLMELLYNFRKEKLLLFSMGSASIAYQIFVGGDPWAYWRMMAPTFPLILVLFNQAALEIFSLILKINLFKEFFSRKPIVPKKFILQSLITLLVIMGSVSVNTRFLNEALLLSRPFDSDYNQGNVDMALIISQLTTPEASVGVFWAGAIPYFTGLKAVDFLGKSDRYIAHLPPDMSGAVGWQGMTSVPGHNKYDLDYSLMVLKPTFAQGVEYFNQDLSGWASDNYVRVDYYGTTFYLLKGSADVLWDKVGTPLFEN